MIDLHGLPQVVTAIGGLGTAAFGLVDASKAVWGGVNHIGFGGIKKTITELTPGRTTNALSREKMLATLQANWFNGTDLPDQKAIAKSLIKLNLSADNAAALASATGVDPAILKEVATNISNGTSLTSAQSDVYARFDLIVTALLDETYQRSDDMYRNWTRLIAMLIAVALAVAGAFMLRDSWALTGTEIGQAVLVGLLATPLAPIAKDLSSALATAVNTLQIVKK
jgi:hypothetical protein